MKSVLNILFFLLIPLIKRDENYSTPCCIVLNDIKSLNEKTYSELKNMNVQELLRLGSKDIDTNNDNAYDSVAVKSRLIKYFKTEDANGYCIIDWETDNFNKLKNSKPKSDEYSFASNQYISLINYIHSIRPNVKASVYGLPFRLNTIRNPSLLPTSLRATNIINTLDFVAPSLYILYSSNEVSIEQNKDYIKRNIEQALKAAAGKPVFAYVGYRIYSKSSRDSWKYIPENEFKDYVEYMKSINFEGKSIQGFIIWNGDFTDNKIKRNEFAERSLTSAEFDTEYNQMALKYIKILTSLYGH